MTGFVGLSGVAQVVTMLDRWGDDIAVGDRVMASLCDKVVCGVVARFADKGDHAHIILRDGTVLCPNLWDIEPIAGTLADPDGPKVAAPDAPACAVPPDVNITVKIDRGYRLHTADEFEESDKLPDELGFYEDSEGDLWSYDGTYWQLLASLRDGGVKPAVYCADMTVDESELMARQYMPMRPVNLDWKVAE